MKKDELSFTKLIKNTLLIAAAWTMIIIGLVVLDIIALTKATDNLVVREARSHFKRDKAFRFWATTHGGFYVPVTQRTPPNPFLSHIPERDIDTPSGLKLTLMNPAYALRQLNEYFTEAYGIAGHITSLRPLRPENTPDVWEKRALELFEKGETEMLEFVQQEGKPFLRLMKPLITQIGCLKCHAHQGYHVGDVRGGVSVSVPMSDYLIEKTQSINSHVFSFSIVWLLGVGFIIMGYIISKRNRIERMNSDKKLQEAFVELDQRVKERTSELTQTNLRLEAEITGRKQQEEKLNDSERKYRSLFENMTSAFALHKIVQDKDDNPTDYIFLEVNDSFERMTGLAKEKLIGKKVTEVFPGIEKESARWIELYGKVASTGEAVQFERFFEPLQKWYLINSYCPKKGYFATVFEDITEQKKSVEELENLKKSLEFQVAEKSKELTENVSELKSFFKESVIRELRMKKLSDKIEELEAELKKKQ